MEVSASEAMVISASEACGLDNGGLGNGGLGNGGLDISSTAHTWNVGKTPLVIGTMLGITQFLNGPPSFNEAAGMSGTDSIQRRHGARSRGVYQGFVHELCNVTSSIGL